ncbi:MAG: hypothetical protein R2826_07230 [Thermoleophilia bacterium]
MDWLILVFGAIGIVIVGYGFVALVAEAHRSRRYTDIGLAVLVAVAITVFLLAYGDRLLR